MSLSANLSGSILLQQLRELKVGIRSLVVPMESFVQHLRVKLSDSSQAITRDDHGFSDYLARWSHIDLQLPAAVVLPANEADTITVVGPVPDP